MKKFITFANPKNFVIITGMFILTPFTYISNPNIPMEVGTSTVATFSQTVENEDNLLFSSSTLFVIKEPIPEAKFIPIEKARKGMVQSIDNENNSFVIKTGDKLLQVESNATTTFYFGDEEKADLNDIHINRKIYVFGHIKSDNSVMLATKIVIANKSKLQRK